MSAKRCSMCDLNLPLDYAGALCPVCEDPDGLDPIENAWPSDDWRKRVAYADFERLHGPAEVT